MGSSTARHALPRPPGRFMTHPLRGPARRWCAAGSVWSAGLLLALPARGAYLIDASYSTSVTIPDTPTLTDSGSLDTSPLDTLLLDPTSTFGADELGAEATTGPDATSTVNVWATGEPPPLGTYTATTTWTGTYLKTTRSDVLTFKVNAPGDSITLLDNGHGHNGLIQMAGWSAILSLDGATVASSAAEIDGDSTQTHTWTLHESGLNPPAGVLYIPDGYLASNNNYTVPAQPITVTVPLTSLPVGALFTVQQTTTASIASVGGESAATSAVGANLAIQHTTRDQVVTNRIYLEAHGAGLYGTFFPAVQPVEHLTLDAAATVCEVNHFNWVQHVTHVPADWVFKLNGNPLTLPMLDPIDSSVDITLTDTATGQTITIARSVEFNDSLTPYINENILLNWIVQGGTGLHFEDSPSVPAGFLNPNNPDDYIGFETELVGVLDDGTIVSLGTHNGTSFTWRTNAINASDTVFLGVRDDGTLPPLLSGGVYDVQIDSATPEPATAALLAVGAASLLTRRRHRSGKCAPPI